jgi:hypothetical protein
VCAEEKTCFNYLGLYDIHVVVTDPLIALVGDGTHIVRCRVLNNPASGLDALTDLKYKLVTILEISRQFPHCEMIFYILKNIFNNLIFYKLAS